MGIHLTPVSLKECDGGDNLLQSGFWGSFKAHFGWKALGVHAETDTGAASFKLLVLLRSLPLGHTLAYVPHGPDAAFFDDDPIGKLRELSTALTRLLPTQTVLLRYDLPWGTRDEDGFPSPLKEPFYKAPMDIQMPDTLFLDISPTEEEILAGMKS